MTTDPMRVLVAVDGSEPAGLAVDLVADRAWPPGTSIVVAEAVDLGPGLFGGPWPAAAIYRVDAIEDELRSAAAATVADARARLVGGDRRVEAVVLSGRPASAIVDQARRMDADLIVLASRGHGTIERMVLGSVSAEVVDHAPAPVLIVRRRTFDRIVVAWDGSSSARRAVDVIGRWPIFRDSPVRVVSVAATEIPWWTGFPDIGVGEVMTAYLDAAAEAKRLNVELAGTLTAELRAAGVAAEADPRVGDPAAEILAAATGWNADLVVMGSHGRTGLERLLLGSVARNVLQHAPCSVLVVRETDARSDRGTEGGGSDRPAPGDGGAAGARSA